MSNQRAGNWKPAAMSDSGDRISIREIISFAQSAQEMLELKGEEDSAFYFEQIVDWLKTNPQKGLRDAGTVLGL
jgi:hypothetical protein